MCSPATSARCLLTLEQRFERDAREVALRDEPARRTLGKATSIPRRLAARDHDHDRWIVAPRELLRNVEAVTVGQADVEQDDRRPKPRRSCERSGHILDVGDIMGIVESFVITSASNTRLVRTIVDEVEKQVHEQFAVKPRGVEGTDDYSWVLIDYGDFVVHVFLTETREFYGLERLWADAARVPWSATG